MAKRKINCIVIHHSASSPETTVEDIRRWHVDGNGWKDIGYHYIIDHKGIVHKARPENHRGAHTKARNSDSIGICVTGNYENIALPKLVMESLVLLLKRLCETHKIPAGMVFGHRDFGKTACPGKHLYGMLPFIRTQLPQQYP